MISIDKCESLQDKNVQSGHIAHMDVSLVSALPSEQTKPSKWKRTNSRIIRPLSVLVVTLSLVLLLTFFVLFWNYTETSHRRKTRKGSVILDHWGKGSPSLTETNLLSQDWMRQFENIETEGFKPFQKPSSSNGDMLSRHESPKDLEDYYYVDYHPMNDGTETERSILTRGFFNEK